MKSPFRFVGFIAFFSLVLGQASQATESYLRVSDPLRLLENAIHYTDSILSEVNLVRAGHFQVKPAVLQGLVPGSWAANFYARVLVDPRNPGAPLDVAVGKQLNDMRAHS